MTEPELEQADAEISRCGSCGDWRWRASYLACQQCGDPSLALRLCPPADLTPEELHERWLWVTHAWAGDLRFHGNQHTEVAA